MQTISKPIIFFGTEDFSLSALTGLIEAGYSIAAVVTKPDSKKGRGQKLTPPSVKYLAEQHNIPVWQPEVLSTISKDIQALDNPIGILVSYGKIIPKNIIDLFSPGIVNVHPSLLPLYRGPSPIESTIKNGDHITGVSLMKLVETMDAGPVYDAREYLLDGTETRPFLYSTLATLGTQFLLELLPTIIDGTLEPHPQDDKAAVYCKLLQKEDAWLKLSSLSAVEAERSVRSNIDFPKSKLLFNNHVVIVTKAHITTTKNTPLDIECQDGAFLSIDELIAPSGRHMNSADFLRGYSV
jgi:methionyl-tRNA formyltransferase